MGTIGDLATVALVGGIGYLVLTKTNILGGGSNQLEITPAKNVSDETKISYDDGYLKKTTTVTDDSGNKYRAETPAGDGWETDAVDVAADLYRTLEPYSAAVIDAAARGDQEKLDAARKDAYLHLGAADNPIAALANGVSSWITSLF